MPEQSSNVPALLCDIVHHARTGGYGTVSSLLNRCILLIQAELARGNTKPAVVAQAAGLLEELLKTQKRGDWVAFADLVEFTFTDFWITNFTAPC
jgi:hypothetical protein